MLAAASTTGAGEFDDLVARYSSGSASLELLADTVMEKWVATAPDDALQAGLPRCLSHAPGTVPRLFALLAATTAGAPATLLPALPREPLRTSCLTSLAAAWGSAGNAEALTAATSLPRHARTLILSAWHEARGLTEAAAAEKSAATLTDPDDREAALRGTFLARAATEPGITLRAAVARDDYPLIAAAAFRHWVPRNPGAAWAFPATMKESHRLTDIVAALLKTEMTRRRLTEALPEIQSLLERVYPAGPPLEIAAVIIPGLAAERTSSAQKFIDFLPEAQRPAARVILYDTLCSTDPAAAWRVAETAVQEGSTDRRTTTTWTSAPARESATPAQRLAAGFPDLTDMTSLAMAWLESDTPTALNTFLNPGVQPALQKLIVETALHPAAAAISRDELLQWAKRQPPATLRTVETILAPASR